MMSLKKLMRNILLLTERAIVTLMQPVKIRQLSRIIIFLTKTTMNTVVMFPPHVCLKDQKKYIRFSLSFFDRKTRKNTQYLVWVSLNISLIFLPTWTDYHLNYLSYYSKRGKVHSELNFITARSNGHHKTTQN